jgi:predicted  nucleic acid-binding Zn-ribbon protein
MSTTNSENSNASKQRLIAIAAVVVVALLAINAVLLFNKFKQDKRIAQQATELEEAEQLANELNEQYEMALADLEQMRGTNENLNSIIDEQAAELASQKAEIDKLIRSGRDLGKARQEIDKLNAQIKQYLAEIAQLKEQNEYLADENTQLSEEREMLSTEVRQQRAVNEELNTAKATLASEKDRLANQNEDLSRTVNFASVVKVGNIDVGGMKVRDNSGKAVRKRYAKNVDQLHICFTTTANEVTRPGREKFYVRIINPIGETLAIEELGSGVMKTNSNEQIRYTQMKEHDYSNDETELCFVWDPNTAFQPGQYTVEIYNKSYLAGSSKFELK